MGILNRFTLADFKRLLNLAGVGNILQATQAALEAETNEDTYAPPDLIQHSPGVAKGLANFTIAAVVNTSKNVTDVTDVSVGEWRVNWATDFSSSYYPLFSVHHTSAPKVHPVIIAESAASTTVRTVDDQATPAKVDPDGPVFVAAFGDQ